MVLLGSWMLVNRDDDGRYRLVLPCRFLTKTRNRGKSDTMVRRILFCGLLGTAFSRRYRLLVLRHHIEIQDYRWCQLASFVDQACGSPTPIEVGGRGGSPVK